MKLFNRYNRISLPVILCIFMLSGLGCYFWIDHLLVRDFDESLAEQAQKIVAFKQKNGIFPKPGLDDEWLITYGRSSVSGSAHFETTLQFDPEDKDSATYRTLTYYYQQGKEPYQIKISRSMEATEGLSRSIGLITVFSLLTVIITTLLLSRFVLRKLWKPFYATLQSLKDFKLGKHESTGFLHTGTEEFDFMNRQLSGMILSAESEYIRLKEFTENASHELQTPLSIIRSKLDIIVQSENLDQRQSKAMESIYLSLKRLTNLGQSLLLLSKIENNQFKEKVNIDLDDKLKDKIVEMGEIWQEKSLQVNLRSTPTIIYANADLVDILLNNVLSNASRHNNRHGTIDIYLQQHEMKVVNTGMAMAIDPSRIFSRFYKQQQYSTNNGLGLAIIKQICDQSAFEVNYEFSGQLHCFTFSF